MLHAKFEDPRPLGSGQEDFFKGFYHISAWWPSWSCDLDYFLFFRISDPPTRIFHIIK